MNRADSLHWYEREAVRTAIYLWRHLHYSRLTKFKELNCVAVYLWDTEEELASLLVGMQRVW